MPKPNPTPSALNHPVTYSDGKALIPPGYREHELGETTGRDTLFAFRRSRNDTWDADDYHAELTIDCLCVFIYITPIHA
jgi:hypothetical protein